MVNPEFPCDPDLEPHIRAGELDAYQAMAITSCRAVVKCQDQIELLQKKISSVASNAPTVTLMPAYRPR